MFLKNMKQRQLRVLWSFLVKLNGDLLVMNPKKGSKITRLSTNSKLEVITHQPGYSHSPTCVIPKILQQVPCLCR